MGGGTLKGLSFVCVSVLYFPNFLQFISTNGDFRRKKKKHGHRILGKNKQKLCQKLWTKAKSGESITNYRDGFTVREALDWD